MVTAKPGLKGSQGKFLPYLIKMPSNMFTAHLWEKDSTVMGHAVMHGIPCL